MPIVDVEIVCEAAQAAGKVSASALADALGQAFGGAPGQTWVRLRLLDRMAYAESGVSPVAGDGPVFVTVLHARLPEGAALQAELTAVTQAVARSVGRAADSVHVQYAPPGAGRQAFGGRLVG